MTFTEYKLAKVPLEWRDADEDGVSYKWRAIVIGNFLIASLEPRPAYCDRGHWVVKCYLPGLDAADGFPRYYMRKNVAEEETIRFLRWRLWKERS